MAKKSTTNTKAKAVQDTDELPDFSHMKRGTPKKEPRTTKDGRLLGEPYEDDVPEQYRNIVPEKKPYKTHSKRRIQQSRANDVARRLKPLALEPDEDLEFSGKKYRIRGLSQNKLNVLISCLRHGVTIETSCKRAGISQSSMYDWMNKGDQGIYPYPRVAEALREAMAYADAEHEKAISDAGLHNDEVVETVTEEVIAADGSKRTKTVTRTKVIPRDWRASAWRMERLRPEIWGIEDKKYDVPQTTTGNSGEDDLIAMDALTLGLSRKITKAQAGISEDEDLQLMGTDAEEKGQ